MLHPLKRIILNCQQAELHMVAKSADNLNEAIDTLLVDKDCREDPNVKIQVGNLNLSDSKCNEAFTTLSELLHHFKHDVTGELLKLDVNRSELWRMGLSFYKKVMKNQLDFRRPFEVKYIFCIQSTLDNLNPNGGQEDYQEQKTKIVRVSESSSYRIGVSIGLALKGPVKRVRHNESLTVGCIEFYLLSIQVIQSQLYIISTVSLSKKHLCHFLVVWK